MAKQREAEPDVVELVSEREDNSPPPDSGKSGDEGDEDEEEYEIEAILEAKRGVFGKVSCLCLD